MTDRLELASHADLVAEVRSLRERLAVTQDEAGNDRALAAETLRTYGRHHDGCQFMAPEGGPCTCGFGEVCT